MRKRIVIFLKTIRALESTLMCGFPLIGTLFAVREPSWGVGFTVLRFLIATYGLVIYVYVLNSWGGIEADRRNARLGDHPVLTGEVTPNQLRAVFFTGLAVSFFLYLIWLPQCFPIAFSIMCVWTIYSHPDILAKAKPVYGNLVHFAGGILQFLLGWVFLSPITWQAFLLAVYFAGIFAAGHLNHEVMDHDADKEMGLATNAVVFGPRRMLNVAFGFFTFWAIYLALVSAAGFAPWRWSAPFLVIFPIHVIAFKTMLPSKEGVYSRSYQKVYRILYVSAGAVVLIERFAEIWK